MIGSPIEEVKSRLDILDVLGGYLKLQKAGANYRALCPFHSEKTPSFFVSPVRQVWRCFGCGVGGDMFKFIMQIEGIEFGDALRQLAQRAGVELKKASPFFAKVQTERKKLAELVEWATKFFEAQFASTSGKEVQAYLTKRGFSKESVEKWRLGYAPDSSNSLANFLTAKGFTSDEISRAGLLVRSERDTFDRFRSRIIFPVFDVNSQAVGFGGRIFGPKAENKEIAKYINTSNTPLYDKSRILYGLDRAKLAIRKQDFAILVEGYVDTILISQAGFENVIAVSGTALTPFHLKLLKRYTSNVHLSFDMDVGGDTATKRGIDLAIGEGFNVKVVVMPEGKDPADVILEDPSIWAKAVEHAKSIFNFYVEQTLERNNKKTAEGKKEIGRILLPLIKRIPNRIEQAHWVSLLSKELETKEEIIAQELAKLPEEQASYIPFTGDTTAKKIEPKTRHERLEERVFILLCKNPVFLSKITDEHIPFFSLQGQEILAALQKTASTGDLNFDALKDLLSEELFEFLEHISLRAGVEDWEQAEGAEDIEEEFAHCLTELEHIALRIQLDEISHKINNAEQAHQGAELKGLLERFNTQSRRLHESS